MDKRLKKYFKLEYRHGKSIAAHFLDNILACAAAFLVSTIFLWSMGARLIPSLLFGGCFTIAAIAISRGIYVSRFEKLVSRLTLAAKDELARERLALSSDSKQNIIAELNKLHPITKRVNGGYLCKDALYFVSIRHPLSKIEPEHVVELIKKFKSSGAKRFYLITTAQISDEASQLLKRNGGSISEEELKKVLTHFQPSTEEAEEYLLKKYDEKKLTADKLKKSFTEKGKTKGWILCSIMLALWGLIFGKGAIYFTSSGICATLAAYCAISNRESK